MKLVCYAVLVAIPMRVEAAAACLLCAAITLAVAPPPGVAAAGEVGQIAAPDVRVPTLAASSSTYRQLGYLFLSPTPGAEFCPRLTTNFLVRFLNISPAAISNLQMFITVSGSLTGPHPGQARIAKDGRTVLYTIGSGFEAGERVTVNLAPASAADGIGSVAPFQYQFMVSTSMPSLGPQPPAIRLSSPWTYSHFPTRSDFLVEAAVSDPDGRVVRVEFYQDGSRIGVATSAPFNLKWSTALPGYRAFCAVAEDNSGFRSTSSVARVTFTNAVSGRNGTESISATSRRTPASASSAAVTASAAEQSGPRIARNGVAVPGDFPIPEITVNRSPAPGYLFVDNVGFSGQRYAMILDNEGSPVWYYRGGARDFKVQKNGWITWAYYTGRDKNFNYIRSFSAVNGFETDGHDLQVLEDGGYLLIGYAYTDGVDMSRYLPGASTNATVESEVVQEFTADGELIFQFRTWDHFDIRDTEPVLENPLSDYVSFTHMNDIDIDTDGNLLLSSRHISEITKVDRSTGDILWRLGGPQGEFTFVNDPLNGFCTQHDVTALGGNRYLLFDNGACHTPQVTRAVEYQLDLSNRTATLVWQFRNEPDLFTWHMGNAQRLPNGNTLMNFVLPDLPKVIEVDSNSVKQFEMNFAPRSDLYRSYRFPWDGVVAAPYLIAEAYPDNVTLVFNKFGDRSVDHYRIFGGTNAAPTNLVAVSKVPLVRVGNVVNGVINYFRVTAVSTNGIESPYSNEESLLVNIVKPGESMVLNGGFSDGTNSWTWAVAGSGTASWRIAHNAALIDLTNGGTRLSDVQLRQAGMKLLRGRQYVLEFDAWAFQPRTIEVRLGQDQAPYATFKTVSASITPAPQHFKVQLTMTNATELNARLAFNLGASSRDVYLDNISLWMVAPGDFNRDGRVAEADLEIFARQWLLQGPALEADLNGDGRVDFNDFAILGENWSGGNVP